jgi:hypothetical protein
MKFTRFASTLLVSTVLMMSNASAQNFASLGSGNFTIFTSPDVTSMPPGSYSQSLSSLTLNGSFAFGAGVLGGALSQAYNWAGADGLGLTMSVAGTNPNFLFSILFFNSSFEQISKYDGSTSGVGSTPATVDLIFDTYSPGFDQSDMNDVFGVEFTWNSEGTINTTIEGIAVVPEPSTWAMLAFGAALFGGLVLRRRLAAVRR